MLREGDFVSVPTHVWGEAYAREQHGEHDWETGRTFGTVLRKEGRKWVCDFGEKEEGVQHAAWSRTALSFYKRGAPRASMDIFDDDGVHMQEVDEEQEPSAHDTTDSTELQFVVASGDAPADVLEVQAMLSGVLADPPIPDGAPGTITTHSPWVDGQEVPLTSR